MLVPCQPFELQGEASRTNICRHGCNMLQVNDISSMCLDCLSHRSPVAMLELKVTRLQSGGLKPRPVLGFHALDDYMSGMMSNLLLFFTSAS